MKIALTGPKELSEFDKLEIENYLKAIINEHEVFILAYRSIEIEVFKFFVNNPEHANKLNIYTYQNLDELPNTLNKTIRFLISQGAHFRSFNNESDVIKREIFINSWRQIIERCDTVVSFYDNEKIALMIPIDEAKEMNKKAIIYYLPGNNIDKYNQEINKKMRNVE